MQITFDTANPQDLEILKAILPKFAPAHHHADAQPAVVNTGSTESAEYHPQSTEVSAVVEAAEEAAPAPVKKRGRTKPEIREEPVFEAAPEPAPIAEPAEVAIPLTIDDVRAALQSYTAKAGIDGGIQLLKNFGAQRISELKAGDYAAFVEACQ